MQCINKKCTAELVDGAQFCHICGRRQQPEPRKHIKRANGTGTVYKLSGRRRRPWVAAKDKVILGYFEKRSEAQETIDSLFKVAVTARYNMTFTEVYEVWKSEHFRDLTPKGVEGYETAYKHLSALYDRKFRELRSEHYQAEIDKLISKGRSHATTNKVKQLASQMSKWAMRECIIQTNYAQFIRLQENKTVEKEIFKKAERDKINNAAKHRDEAKLVKMLINTGMRIGELFTLETDKVHEKYCIGGEKSEAGRDRIIPIPPEIREEFAYFKTRADGKELLIEGYEGNRTVENFRKRDYKDLLTDLGIEYKSPHCTRHTYASMARDSGMAPELLQKILGHAQYSTTANIYVHADVDLLITAAENLNKKKTEKKKKSKPDGNDRVTNNTNK